MTLLIALIAAATTTLVWYCNEKAREMKIFVLACAYWGASIMWFVDAVFEYIELRSEFFTPAAEDMLNDAFLGVSVVVLGFVVWVISVIIRDPSRIIRRAK